jgi:hypothetical protein
LLPASKPVESEPPPPPDPAELYARVVAARIGNGSLID